MYRYRSWSQDWTHFSRGSGIPRSCGLVINAGYHIRSNADRKSTKIVSAGLLHAVTVRRRFYTREKIRVCKRRPSIAMFSFRHHSRILLCITRSNHLAMLGNREIGLSLFSVRYMPSLDRQIVLAILPALKNVPFIAHLLNSQVIVFRYSVGNFLSKKADVPTLSLDFYGSLVGLVS